MTLALAHSTRSSFEMVLLQPDEVIVTGRHRTDLGDLSGLMESIKDVGVMNPITVTTDMHLVAGGRRLEAVRRLGLPLIRACVASDLSQVEKRLIAERDENTCRLEMKPSEKASLGLALEELERPKAAERKMTHGVAAMNNCAPNFGAQSSRSHEGEVDTVVGAAVGMSRTTYHRAKAVLCAGRDGTDLGGNPLPDDVIEVAKAALVEMDATGKVTGPYKKLASARTEHSLVADDPTARRSGKSRADVEKRWAKVRELAATAHTSRQAAKKVGLTFESLRAGARERGIEFPADAVVGVTRRIDPSRVVEETVIGLDHSVASLSAFDIDFTALEVTQVAHWVTSLEQSIKALTRFKNQLKEMTQ